MINNGLALVVIVAIIPASLAQLPTKISADDLRNVHKASTLDKSVAFRCGLFFPNPKDDNAKPVAPLFVFNNSWSAPECPNGGDADRYSKFCTSIVKPISERLVLKDKSLYRPHAEAGLSIGDDICGVLKNKVNAPFVGPPKSKKFPDGIKFGMYYNQCGEKKWKDAGFRHYETVCCENGKYKNC